MCEKVGAVATKCFEVVGKAVTYIGTLAIVVGYVSRCFEWGNKWLFGWLADNVRVVWSVTVTAFLVMLWIWVSRLRGRFARGFRDNFTGDLRRNWDFTGEWRIVEKGTLLVDKSPAGGLTKAGAQWENYTLKFRAFIVNKCLGVVVRAQDLNNYYMFQIRKDKIRPHRRVAVPAIVKRTVAGGNNKDLSEETTDDFDINYKVGWQLFEENNIDISPPLEGWFDVQLTVRGESVSLYINKELLLQLESFLKIPCGKVGFRNFDSEIAKVENVKVILEA